jgi:hypothetical protein
MAGLIIPSVPSDPVSMPIETGNSGSADGEYRDCSVCKFATRQSIENCPECDVKLHTETELRKSGSLMVAMGGVMALMMVGVIAGLVGLLVYQFVIKEAIGIKPADRRNLVFYVMMAIAFAAAILAFGVGNIIAGRHQHETGRRDRRTMKIAMLILTGSLAAMGLIRFALD